MSKASISPRRLLKDSFIYVKPIYFRTLVFFVPSLLFSFISDSDFNSPSDNLVFNFAYIIFVLPFFTGASIFFVYQNLTQRGATIPDSLQKAGERFLQLVTANFLVIMVIFIIPFFAWGFCTAISDSISGMLFFGVIFFIPAFYSFVRLTYFMYAIMIEERLAFEAIARSWKLTKGRWWLIFWTLIIPLIFIIIPVIIVTFFSFILHPDLTEVASSSIAFLIWPIFIVYYVFVFISLVNLLNPIPIET